MYNFLPDCVSKGSRFNKCLFILFFSFITTLIKCIYTMSRCTILCYYAVPNYPRPALTLIYIENKTQWLSTSVTPFSGSFVHCIFPSSAAPMQRLGKLITAPLLAAPALTFIYFALFCLGRKCFIFDRILVRIYLGMWFWVSTGSRFLH